MSAEGEKIVESVNAEVPVEAAPETKVEGTALEIGAES